jgi:alanyl-tRNA synthetase
VTTERLYRTDPYLLEFNARVVDRRERDGRPAVVLDRTAFYAESGGQPWDTGILGGVPVRAVLEDGEDVLHVLEGPLAADTVHGVVDGGRRRDHRQQHHGQHLLSRAFFEIRGARTVSFHLGAEVSTIDLDREVTEANCAAAEERTNQVVWEARPVGVRTVTRSEADAAGVTAPEGAGDAIRLVEVPGFDVQPCGGTHPRSTAEVGVVLVLGRERYKGGTRVRFVCGHRALRASRARVSLLDRLGTLLSAAPEALPEAAERALAQAAAAERRSRELLERALEGEARRLLSAPAERPSGDPEAARVVVAAYDGWPAADLRALAGHLARLEPCLALLGSRFDKAHLVFAQTPGLRHDVPGLLSRAAQRLDGRGGGRGDVAQGGGDRLDLLDEALRLASHEVLRPGDRGGT